MIFLVLLIEENNLFKAFGTVDHEILISKLEHYTIKGKKLKWVKSYLSE